jgi:hypothetical protein
MSNPSPRLAEEGNIAVQGNQLIDYLSLATARLGLLRLFTSSRKSSETIAESGCSRPRILEQVGNAIGHEGLRHELADILLDRVPAAAALPGGVFDGIGTDPTDSSKRLSRLGIVGMRE